MLDSVVGTLTMDDTGGLCCISRTLFAKLVVALLHAWLSLLLDEARGGKPTSKVQDQS